MSKTAQRKRSQRGNTTPARIARLRRFSVPIGSDGRLYAAYRRLQWNVDWPAGTLIPEKGQRKLLRTLEAIKVAERIVNGASLDELVAAGATPEEIVAAVTAGATTPEEILAAAGAQDPEPEDRTSDG